MAFLDRISPEIRQWNRRAELCRVQLIRAAGIQARQCAVASLQEESARLAALYNLPRQPRSWREMGEVAFHLIARWPPDLAYLILYGFRETPEIGWDPVPVVLKAVEMQPRFQPRRAALKISPEDPSTKRLIEDPSERGRHCARLLCREISFVPLPYASGIFHEFISETKGFVREELRRFNPEGLSVLENGRPYRLLTRTALVKAIGKLVFGGIPEE